MSKERSNRWCEERPGTIRDAYVQASSFLNGKQVKDAENCSELILCHLFQWDHTTFLLNFGDAMPEEKLDDWIDMVERKAKGEPVQYIVGSQAFYDLTFDVSPAVLIPRPETEWLVEKMIAYGKKLFPHAVSSEGLESTHSVGSGEGSESNRSVGMGEGSESNRSVGMGEGSDANSSVDSSSYAGAGFYGDLQSQLQQPVRHTSPAIVDVGTGSGAIAVTIASHCPDWRVYSSDLSVEALKMAQHNAEKLGVREKITFLQGDLLLPYIAELREGRAPQLDILVSNPPYIPTGDLLDLEPEVRVYEPSSALDGGADGLHLYRRLVEQMLLLPVLPRLVGLEVGAGQAQDVQRLLKEIQGWSHYEIVMDLAGIERHVLAWREEEYE